MDTIRDKRGFKFGKTPTQVLFNPKLTSHAKVVYAALDKYADNETAVAFPGQEILSEKIGISRPTITRAVGELVEHRFIRVKRIVTRKGWRNEYTLLHLR